MTIVTQFEEHRSHGLPVPSRSGNDRQFRAAVRHSRKVRLMRWALPLCVVLGVSAIAIMSWLNPLKLLTKLPIEIGNVVVSGSKITMQQPRLAGVTRDARPYEVLANAAAQDINNPDMLELDDIRAKMELRDNTMLDVKAHKGTYNSKTELLTLRQDVVIITDTYEARLTEAVFDVRKNSMLSEKPVVVKMQQGTIKANRLEITGSGESIVFDQGVTLDLDASGGFKP